MEVLLLIIGVVAIVALASIWRGFVLSILWGWFAVPLGLPPIGIAWAIGVATVVGMLAGSYSEDKEDKDDGWKKVIVLFVAPLIALGVGWVAHASM